MPASLIAERAAPQGRDDAIRWVVVLVLVFAALMAALATRKVVSPIDSLITNRVCTAHGKAIGHSLIGYERSNRLALANRTSGSCTYAPAQGETENLVVPIPEANPGSLYSGVKVMTLLLQLGAASAAIRLLADPLLDRFVRPRPGS